MTHPRKLIRDSVTTGLVALNTAAQSRVWASREPPVNVESILLDEVDGGPVILVYTRNDRSPKDGHAPQGFGWVKREVTLYIEITCAGAIVLDDKLDEMAEQVELFMDAFAVPGKPAWEIRHVETTIESTLEFEAPVGGALLEYEACYWREWRGDSDVEEDPFFPTTVIANGDEVANCDDCDDCPDGAPEFGPGGDVVGRFGE
jgi:hypothetical protein